MSPDLAKKLRLGLGVLAAIREEMAPILALPADGDIGVIERAAACSMLHSFYTEIEKILTLVAREWDGQLPASDSWHKELLNRMAASTITRPAILSRPLVEVLSEFLAFRHLFRGASIVLMRWEKLAPLVAKVDPTYDRTEAEIGAFVRFVEAAEQ